MISKEDTRIMSFEVKKLDGNMAELTITVPVR